MYTANTMASSIEALGMSLPGSSSQDAVSNDKKQDCLNAGAAIKNLLDLDIKPSDIMTKKAFENSIAVVIALGVQQMLFCIFLLWPTRLVLTLILMTLHA